jgi:hypothetical protein
MFHVKHRGDAVSERKIWLLSGVILGKRVNRPGVSGNFALNRCWIGRERVATWRLALDEIPAERQ